MLSHLIERRDEFIGDASAYAKWLSSKFGNMTRSGVSVDDYSALNHSAVWAGVDFISSTMATLPLRLKRTETTSAGVKNSVLHEGPRANLFTRSPNGYQTAYRFVQLLQAQATFYGNGYAYIDRNPKTLHVEALYPLKPRQTDVRLEDGTVVYETILNGKPTTLDAGQVLHIPGFTLDDGFGLKGLSFIDYARKAIGLGLAAQEFGSAFFGSGANPRFVVTHPGDVGPEGMQRLTEQLNSLYGGLDNSHKAAVLDEGMKLETLSLSPEDSQMLDTKKDNRVEIAGMLRIPPQVIGIYDRATWANAEHMDIFVVKYTLNSWFARWEQELNLKTLTEADRAKGLHWKFNANALLRGDIKARTEFYKAMLAGVMTGNEIRALEDLRALPGLDEPYIPLNTAAASAMTGDAPDDDPDLIIEPGPQKA